ncbi:MAG: hypothetical protein JNM45_00610 [Rhizobiales bacterium]|nr:hypothetical protein [Hyphomicrobiales bacterium]
MKHTRSILSAAALCCTLLMPAAVHAQEREWMLDAADEDAFLVFGVPETDDVGVSLWCKLGSAKVRLYFPEGSPELKPNSTAAYVLTVGDRNYKLRGKTTANDLTGSTSVETELPASDPLFAALLKADRFVAKIGKHELTYPLIDTGLDNLLKLCTEKPAAE